MIDIEHEPGAPACIVRLEGDVDFSAVPEVRAAIGETVGEGCANVVLDLSRVTYADSSALGLLVWIDKLVNPYGGKLVLAGADRNVSRVLELSGLIGVAPSVCEARDVSDALGGLDLTADSRPPLWTRRLAGPAVVDGMARMRQQVVEWVAPLELEDAALFDLKVAVGEALANAVRHGSHSDDDLIAVEVVAHDDRVEVLVSDQGHGFDGEHVCDQDVYASGGRGVMFMRALTDRVEFFTNEDGGTTVRLVKRRRVAPAARP